MSDDVGWIRNPNGRVSKDVRVHAMNKTEICFRCCGSGSYKGSECQVCMGLGKLRAVPRA